VLGRNGSMGVSVQGGFTYKCTGNTQLLPSFVQQEGTQC
jgi:hypothetical protein